MAPPVMKPDPSLEDIARTSAADVYCPACGDEHVDVVDPVVTLLEADALQRRYLLRGRCSKCRSVIESGLTEWVIGLASR